MKIVLTIFILPYEIDDLEIIFHQLKKAAYQIDPVNEWVVDVTMCVAEDMIDWRKSSIARSYFIEKLQRIALQTDWCKKTFRISSDIKGCVAQRRFTLYNYPDADCFIWADADIIFGDMTLSSIETAARRLSEDFDYFVISPEIVRMWDTTWDCLVNDEYIDKPIGYQAINDPYLDCGKKGEITLEQVLNTVQGQPRMKFGGGFFTCFSNKLLKRAGIPESLGQYGYEDTFIMWAAEKLIKESGENIVQFKMKNLVVCENYKYRSYSHLLNHLSVYNRKDEFKKIAESNFKTALKEVQ